MSVTSSVSASASCPRARIACAASSISLDVRAASVTAAPASASAAAAVSPMPRPAPVTSARMPSRRKEGVLVNSTTMQRMLSYPSPERGGWMRAKRAAGWGHGLAPHLVAFGDHPPPSGGGISKSFRRLCVGHVAAAIAAHANISLLGMGDEAFQNAKPRAVFADHGGSLIGQHLLIGARLEKLADPEPAGEARVLLGRQRVVGADHLVAIGDIGAGA